MKQKKQKRPRWASVWAKHNVIALKKELEGNHYDAETHRLQASLAKDFVIINGLQNELLKMLAP